MIDRALAEVDPAIRAQFFDGVSMRQADPRPGVGLRDGRLPDLAWRLVPAGSYWMGGDPVALRAWSGRSIHLASNYWTAAYPVTIAQYQTFIADGGYSEQRRACWTSVGWAWKSRYNSGHGLDAPLGWNATGGRPRIGNHPVQVNWYEAFAYAQWLEALRRGGRIVVPDSVPDDHVIRLPDEAEREWTARYPDGRFFPWGNDYRSGYANIDETSYYERVGPHNLGRITAVGLYPLGRQPLLGVYDLSGNVSEWCLTMWDERGDAADNDPEGVGHRVVRGGHYRNGSTFARAASRTWGDPDPDDQYDSSHGFRLVIGPCVRSRQE